MSSPLEPITLYGNNDLTKNIIARPTSEPFLLVINHNHPLDRSELWKWSLAFQSVVNIGVRGTEQVRTRVVQAGMLDVVGAVLKAWSNGMEHKRRLGILGHSHASSGQSTQANTQAEQNNHSNHQNIVSETNSVMQLPDELSEREHPCQSFQGQRSFLLY